MKKPSLRLSTLLLLFISCNRIADIEKRHYRDGFYIQKNHSAATTPTAISPSKEFFSPQKFSVDTSHSQTEKIVAAIPNDTLQSTSFSSSQIVRSTDTIQNSTTGAHKLKSNHDPKTPATKEEIEDKLDDSKSLMMIGILVPYVGLAGLIVLMIAQHRMKEAGIQDEALKNQISRLYGLFFLILGIKIAIGVLLFFAIVSLFNASGGCYIATMVYGSYNAREVLVLRKFRDEKLKPYLVGRIFIAIYYSLSPIFVRIFRNNKFVNSFCKSILDRWVKQLSADSGLHAKKIAVHQ